MSEEMFLTALGEITAGRSSLGELITAASGLVAAGCRPQAEQLYKVWINFNPDHPSAMSPISTAPVCSRTAASWKAPG